MTDFAFDVLSIVVAILTGVMGWLMMLMGSINIKEKRIALGIVCFVSGLCTWGYSVYILLSLWLRI